MEFRNRIIRNNSHLYYYSFGRNRLYCRTGNPHCCNGILGEWYLPDGTQVLGGYEYSRSNVFARSRGNQNIGLYQHGHPSERGAFRCELPDVNGTNQTLIVYIVNEFPSIRRHPASQLALVGEHAQFSVNISSRYPVLCQWQKNQVDLSDGEKYQGTTSAILTIFNAQKEDQGLYRCGIDVHRYYIHTVSSTSAKLSVGKYTRNECPYYTTMPCIYVQTHAVVPIEIDMSTLKLSVIGDKVAFKVTVNTTDSHVPLFQWQKDDVNISRNYESFQFGTTISVLKIADVQHEDAGQYRCSVKDKSKILQLVVGLSLIHI